MHTPPFSKLLLASAIALALSACGSSGDYVAPAEPVIPPPPVVEAGDSVMLTASGRLASFNLDSPATLRTSLAVSGLQAGEVLLGIDFRPADGNLYGVGNSGRIYTLNPTTGVATLKSTLVADAADTTTPFAKLEGTEFGVDFNPAADRLRVVGSFGQSLRINVDTGATTTDGSINGGVASTAINAAAYTNSFAGTANTTLFVIDAANSTLYTQSPPNNGTLASPVPLGVNASVVGGFDIDARNNKGYAVMTVGGARNLYAINVGATSAAATLVAALGVTEDVKGFALRAVKAPLVYGLTDSGRIIGFKPLTPSTLDTDVAITGLASGEKLLGIDIRPKDGLMYAISSTGRIHTIDPVTGVATFKVALAADAADLTLPFSVVAGSEFAVDFNPVADRLRVISNAGQSLRINVDTGAATTDGAINRAGATPVVTAGAYTNSFAGTTATMLMVLDSQSDNLALQNPPNEGTLTNIGALGVDLSGDSGMDIAGGANGLVLAALRTAGAGPSRLYRIDLATGAALPVNGAANAALSVIGAGTVNVLDIAVSLK
ncbi:MAG: DUF4394 domain-containing protein [Telluria sp.]